MNYVFIALLMIISFKSPAGSVSIEVQNLRSNKGHVLISVYNNAKDFPNDATKAVGKSKVSIQNGKAIATFNDLPGSK